MPKRRKILYPVHFSQAAEGAPAGGGSGQQAPPAGTAAHSAAAQAAAAAAATGDQGASGDQKPAGYVPVGELAQERQKRHEAEAAATAAKTAADQQLAAFKQALGLTEGQTPEQLQAAAAAAQSTATQAQTQLAVFQLAKDAGGDAHALLDSASFLNSIKTLDPTNKDAITTAIKAAVDSNKSLAYRKVAPGGSHDAGQGAGGGSATPTISDAIRALAGK